MNVLDAIKNRRAVKHYDPKHKLSSQDEQSLLNLAIQAPTAFNIQHWRFVHVKDPEVRAELRAVAWDQAQVTDASMLLVLCADLNAWQKSPQRYWRNAPEAVQSFMLPAIDEYYRDKEQVQRDECMRSCGIVAQTLMLAAQGLGLESCPMDGFNFEQVAEIIRLPEDHLISMMLAIGKGVETARPKGGQLPLEQVVIVDKF